MTILLDYLRDQLVSQRATPQAFCIAYSGGLDSHVLLHLMAQLQQQFPTIALRAIHVHHGLNPRADSWVEHCRHTCAGLNIDFHCEYLQGSPSRGQSVEAWARESRYAALAKHLSSEEWLITAHTEDDQAETVLLQLLRGAGPKGLAAMPQCQSLASGYLYRPLLNFSRAELQEYAKCNHLLWLEDDSNSDLRFDRNFLRHQIIPVLRQRWPGLSPNLARTAEHCAAAAHNLRELAQQDLGEYVQAKILPLPVLQILSPDRQRNALREWLTQLGCRLPNTRHIHRIQQDLLAGRNDSQPQVSWDCWTIRRYRQELIVTAVHAANLTIPQNIRWDLSSPLLLPDSLGTLTAVKEKNGGLSLAIDPGRLSIGFRLGGERCRLPGKNHSTALKKLFQQWQIPPWQRDSIPLLYHDDQIAAVIGYCICAPFAASPHEISWKITFYS